MRSNMFFLFVPRWILFKLYKADAIKRNITLELTKLVLTT